MAHLLPCLLPHLRVSMYGGATLFLDGHIEPQFFLQACFVNFSGHEVCFLTNYVQSENCRNIIEQLRYEIQPYSRWFRRISRTVDKNWRSAAGCVLLIAELILWRIAIGIFPCNRCHWVLREEDFILLGQHWLGKFLWHSDEESLLNHYCMQLV